MTPDRDIILSAPWLARRSWLRRLGRSNALTMAVSVALHAGLFLSFYRIVFSEPSEPRRLIIPEARLAPAGSGGIPAGEAPRPDPSPPPPPSGGVASSEFTGPVHASGLQVDELPVLAVNLTGPSGLVVGAGSTGIAAHAGTSGVTGGGSLLGSGYATGIPGGGLVGPATSFFGAAGNAYRVVYVVDVSNSLMFTVDRLIRKEMGDAVRQLSPSQEFHIILSTPVRIIQMDPPRLVYATGANKQVALQFIDRHVRRGDAGTDHAASLALQQAFDLRPELVYFLSDGDYQENEKTALRALLKERSARGGTKLTALGFGQGGDYLLLEQLARQTGGHYRYIDYR